MGRTYSEWEDTMPSGGWSAASIVYVMADKLPRCFRDKVTVEEGAESLTMTMQNGQVFVMSLTELVKRDSLGRLVRKRIKLK